MKRLSEVPDNTGKQVIVNTVVQVLQPVGAPVNFA
jgi:hypothetical protein